MASYPNLDPRIAAGAAHARAQLDCMEVAQGSHDAQAHAAGLVLGIRDYLVGKRGTMETYAILQNFADSTVNPVLNARYIEVELAAMLRQYRKRPAA